MIFLTYWFVLFCGVTFPAYWALIQYPRARLVLALGVGLHYPVVGGALLYTLEKGLGEDWTPELADAWTAAFGTLSGYMISEAYGRAEAAE